MSRTINATGAGPKGVQLRSLDRTCDTFESAWLSGERPAVEEYLGDTPEPDRTELLGELIRVEVHYRRKSGEAPHPSDYRTRFPTVPDALLSNVVGISLPVLGAAVNGFRLKEELGHGGMGKVYRAAHPRLDQDVALKVLKPGLESGPIVARFEAERQALARMDHPHIARVIDGGVTEEGRPFFVMELVSGLPITRYCDEHRLNVRERLKLFISVCQAVQHAHQKGIIHRDLKPSNILVAEYDGKPAPKIIDFGIARATERRATIQTEAGMLVGTPQYMSPEQADLASQDIDTRSDIYSLGVVLFEMLTRETPFARQSEDVPILEVLRMIREVDPPPPSSRWSAAGNNELRGDLDWITLKCLEKDRARRYDTAAALADDVQRFLDDEPVLAGPPSKTYRLRKFLRRNRGRVAAAAIILVTLLGGIVGTTLSAIRANRERDNKQTALDELEKQQRTTEAALTAETHARIRAMSALRSLTDDVVQRLMARQATLTDEDRAFLARIVREFEAFAAVRGENEESRSIRAEGQMRVGLLRGALGESLEALRSYEQAIEMYKTLAADFPSKKGYRRQLAACHRNIGGVLCDLKRNSEAETALRLAIDEFKALDIDPAEEPGWMLDWAKSHGQLASLYSLGNQHEAAFEQFRHVASILQQRTGDSPSDLESRVLQAHHHHNLGSALQKAQKHEEADEEHRIALELFQRLASDFPGNPKCRLDLGNAQLSRAARLFDLRKTQDGESAYRAALGNWKQLAADFPTVPQYRRQLASGHFSYAVQLVALKKNNEAAAEYRAAVAVWKQLAADFPAVPSYRNELATSYNNLGNLNRALKNFAESETQIQMAIKLRKELVDESPTNPEYAVNLGGSYCNWGNHLFRTGKTKEALEWYDQAITVLTPVNKLDVMHSRTYLYNSHRSRANALGRMQQFSEALPDWNRALELADSANRGETRLLRSACLARIDPDQAASEAEDVCRGAQASGRFLYLGATTNALASAQTPETAMREHYAMRAVALLGQAKQRGHFNNPAQVESLKKDPAFQLLAPREDFQNLLSEIESNRFKE